MELLDCPTEVVEFIAEKAMPDGFEAFALTCKRIYEATGRFRERHNQLKKRYRHLEYDQVKVSWGERKDFVHDETLILRPLHLLQRIADDPLIARYITSAELVKFPAIEDDPRMDFLKRVKSTTSLLSLLQSSPYLKAAFIDPAKFYEILLLEYSHCLTETATTFLLSLLPNLTTVALRHSARGSSLGANPNPDFECLRDQLLPVIIRRANDNYDSTASLSKLSSIAAVSESFDAIDVKPYLSIKSLQSYSVNFEAIPQKRPLPFWFQHDQLSHERSTEAVETVAVRWTTGYCPHYQLGRFLRDFPRIKTLKLCCGFYRYDDPITMLERIKFLSDTLEELHFMDVHHPREGRLFVNSIHSFEKLKCLKLDFEIVCNDPTMRAVIPTIRRFLPRTLEKLVLVTDQFFVNLDKLWTFFYELEDKDRVLPYLKNIIILTARGGSPMDNFESLSARSMQQYECLKSCDRIQIIHTEMTSSDLRLKVLENW